MTIVFCDLVESTSIGEALDPEALRTLLQRYSESAKAIVELHGGSVEKFIGDAVMAVFGVPAAHEDDALRAVRAAVEMRGAVTGLGLEGRIGITTGEVVAGTDERLATGDAVNVAARLEQAAAAGEILIGEATLRLVEDACEVETMEPLALKGKSQPVPAFRVVAVHDPTARHATSRFVGRRDEFDALLGLWSRAVAEERCELATVVGDAGIGKSRLAAELARRIDADVVRGRCLPYGEGITYWPVVEIVKQLDLVPTDTDVTAAIGSLLENVVATTPADEIAWAFRKMLEQASARRPLLVVFDDLHWGSETFLDLVEHVALLSSGAPMLLLCLARPELLDRRSAWPVTLRLEPLAPAEADELIPAGLAEEFRARVARAAAGNPLFLQEMLAMAADRGDVLTVPPTLQALLAARLDQLEGHQRELLEIGAIEGEVFHRRTVQTLASTTEPVTPGLVALVRNQLIRPIKGQFADDDGFRFCHLLMRDAAYAALPKRVRAELHVAFARWLESERPTLGELPEIAGYHLAQACLYLAELGLPVDPATTASARAHLGSAGSRAASRGDYAAATRLFREAEAVVPPEELDLPLHVNLMESLFWSGKGRDAVVQARRVADRAAQAGDRVAERCALIKEALFQTLLEPEGATARLADLLERAVPEFAAAGDDLALSVAYQAQCQVAIMRGHTDAMLEAADLAALHGERAGRPHVELTRRASARFYGSTPAPELLAWLDEQRENVAWSERLDARRPLRALTLAMLGRFDEARAVLAELGAVWEERGGGIHLANLLGQDTIDVERWAGNPSAAVEAGAEAMKMYEAMGQQSYMSTAAAKFAHALYELGRCEEAETWAERAADLGASDDIYTQMLWRQVKAKVWARAGAAAAAEELAREAVRIAGETDMVDAEADAWADLGEVLRLAGAADDAATAFAEARRRYEEKGNLASLRLLEKRPPAGASSATGRSG